LSFLNRLPCPGLISYAIVITFLWLGKLEENFGAKYPGKILERPPLATGEGEGARVYA
jgi:hypothetical protein